jgi:hypothetical protein
MTQHSTTTRGATARRSTPLRDTPLREKVSNAAMMRGNKAPQLHRFFLSDGRVLRGELHRSPSMRLVDQLAGLKDFVSVTNAQREGAPEVLPYLAVNLANVLYIEELLPDSADSGAEGECS